MSPLANAKARYNNTKENAKEKGEEIPDYLGRKGLVAGITDVEKGS